MLNNKEANFLILPTKAECSGQVFQEAAAFGVPSLSFNTGGISSVLLDGISGLLLPVESSASVFAKKMEDIWRSREHYLTLSTSSRKCYEQNFTEAIWGQRMSELFQKTLANV